MAPIQKPQELTDLSQTSSVKPFDSIPGPKGLPVIGTLFDYMKKDGFRFNKLFEVGIFRLLSNTSGWSLFMFEIYKVNEIYI